MSVTTTVTGTMMDLTSPEYEEFQAAHRIAPGYERKEAAAEAAKPKRTSRLKVVPEAPGRSQRQTVACRLMLAAFDGDAMSAIEALMESLDA